MNRSLPGLHNYPKRQQGSSHEGEYFHPFPMKGVKQPDCGLRTLIVKIFAMQIIEWWNQSDLSSDLVMNNTTPGKQNWRRENNKASSSGERKMSARILRAAEQISTSPTDRLNNDGFRRGLHLWLNDTKAIYLYSFGAFFSALWWREIYLSLVSGGKKHSRLFPPKTQRHQCTTARHELGVTLLMFWHGTKLKIGLLSSSPSPVMAFFLVCHLGLMTIWNQRAPHKLFPVNWSLRLKATTGDSAVRTFSGAAQRLFLLLFSVCAPAVCNPSPRLGSARLAVAAPAELSGRGFNSLWRCTADHSFSESHREIATTLLVFGAKMTRHCAWNGYKMEKKAPVLLLWVSIRRRIIFVGTETGFKWWKNLFKLVKSICF